MVFLSYIAILMTAALLDYPKKDNKTYTVKSIRDELPLTGKGDNSLWKKASELSDFIYPWENEQPPLTSFKALHSKDWLYCVFYVKDDNIKVYVDKNDKSEVVFSDRAEIFFKKDDLLSPYYGLELDPLGRIYDYQAEFHRKFDRTWSWPNGQLVVKTARTDDGYTIELAISKASLVQLGLLKNKILQAGLYRGECVELVGKEATIKWISWVRPASETPDFHIPSSFGMLLLED
jgi:hypothetical protein